MKRRVFLRKFTGDPLGNSAFHINILGLNFSSLISTMTTSVVILATFFTIHAIMNNLNL